MDLAIAHSFLRMMGGGERVVLEIAKKFNPVIYTAFYEPENTFEEFKEFDVRVLPKSKMEIPFFWLKGDKRRFGAVAGGFRFSFHKIKDDYDVLNCQGCPSEFFAMRNERVCWYIHSPNREAFDLRDYRLSRMPIHKQMISMSLTEVYKAVEFSVLPKIKYLVANSQTTNERIKKYFNRNDAEIINPGVDTERFTCSSYDKYFLYPSRIIPEKRFEFVIEAFKLFHKERKDFKLLIVGFAQNQEYLDSLKKCAEGYPVEFVLSPSDEKFAEIYSNCYATLFSAMDEEWGLVPLESMSARKPCISIAEGGPRETIVHSKTGFLVHSWYEMKEWMLFLAENPNLVEEMGKEGRKRVLKNYTWDIFHSKMRRKFKEVHNEG